MMVTRIMCKICQIGGYPFHYKNPKLGIIYVKVLVYCVPNPWLVMEGPLDPYFNMRWYCGTVGYPLMGGNSSLLKNLFLE